MFCEKLVGTIAVHQQPLDGAALSHVDIGRARSSDQDVVEYSTTDTQVGLDQALIVAVQRLKMLLQEVERHATRERDALVDQLDLREGRRLRLDLFQKSPAIQVGRPVRPQEVGGIDVARKSRTIAQQNPVTPATEQ